MNYTKENAKYMCKEYNNSPTQETVARLMGELDKPKRSIIGKLSREGVYRREIYKTKLGEIPITKIEIVHQISEVLDIEPEEFVGLDKAPKRVLKLLCELTLERQKAAENNK